MQPYKVVGNVPTPGRDATGKPVDGHLVTAQMLGSGSQFQVFVPNTLYTVANVTAALDAKAETVAGVDAIGS